MRARGGVGHVLHATIVTSGRRPVDADGAPGWLRRFGQQPGQRRARGRHGRRDRWRRRWLGRVRWPRWPGGPGWIDGRGRRQRRREWRPGWVRRRERGRRKGRGGG